MVVFRNLPYATVQGMQIIRALNVNINQGNPFTEGELYKLQQAVANEARSRGLLINPNPYGRAGFGDTSVMEPSLGGWEQTKGIQRRVLGSLRMDEIAQPSNGVSRLGREGRRVLG